MLKVKVICRYLIFNLSYSAPMGLRSDWITHPRGGSGRHLTLFLLLGGALRSMLGKIGRCMKEYIVAVVSDLPACETSYCTWLVISEYHRILNFIISICCAIESLNNIVYKSKRKACQGHLVLIYCTFTDGIRMSFFWTVVRV